MIFTNFFLEVALPVGNHFMIRFCSWRKIIGFVDALFVEVHMNVRQPLVVLLHANCRLNLCHPGPIAVEIKQVMVGAATRPSFIVARAEALHVNWVGAILIVKVDIAVTAIRVQARIHDHKCVFKIASLVCEQAIGRLHGSFSTRTFIAMYVVGQPNNRQLFVWGLREVFLLDFTQFFEILGGADIDH